MHEQARQMTADFDILRNQHEMISAEIHHVRKSAAERTEQIESECCALRHHRDQLSVEADQVRRDADERMEGMNGECIAFRRLLDALSAEADRARKSADERTGQMDAECCALRHQLELFSAEAAHAQKGADERAGQMHAECFALLHQREIISAEVHQVRSDAGERSEKMTAEYIALRHQHEALSAETSEVRSDASERSELMSAEYHALHHQHEALSAGVSQVRTEVHEARVRCSAAERELLRRTGEEFASLRAVQVELERMKAEMLAFNAPLLHSDPASAAVLLLGWSTAAAAEKPRQTQMACRAMALSFVAATTRAWLRLYLHTWRALVRSRVLAMSFAGDRAALRRACVCDRAVFAWFLAAERGRHLSVMTRFVDRQRTSMWGCLLRALLRAWWRVPAGDAETAWCLVPPAAAAASPSAIIHRCSVSEGAIRDRPGSLWGGHSLQGQPAISLDVPESSFGSFPLPLIHARSSDESKEEGLSQDFGLHQGQQLNLLAGDCRVTLTSRPLEREEAEAQQPVGVLRRHALEPGPVAFPVPLPAPATLPAVECPGYFSRHASALLQSSDVSAVALCADPRSCRASPTQTPALQGRGALWASMPAVKQATPRSAAALAVLAATAPAAAPETATMTATLSPPLMPRPTPRATPRGVAAAYAAVTLLAPAPAPAQMSAPNPVMPKPTRPTGPDVFWLATPPGSPKMIGLPSPPLVTHVQEGGASGCHLRRGPTTPTLGGSCYDWPTQPPA